MSLIQHFHPKSLLFYGTMIGSVTLLFRLVTLYGETRLEAPRDLNGQYVSVDRLTGCPADDRLALTVQQSGVYLSGSLRLVEPTTAVPVSTEEKPSLSGQWQEPQMILSGTTDALSGCQTTGDPQVPVSLQGQFSESEPDTFIGEIQFGTDGESVEFTAQRQAAEPAQQNGH